MPERALPNHPADLQHPLGTHVQGNLVWFRCNGRVGNDLNQAEAVAQVEESHPTVIAAAMNPPSQGDFLADMSQAQLSTGVRLVHGFSSGTK
jgi:UDP-N-acetyl-D-mannosaminuronic acid transferase (WecB/TagA/CpsF family)